MNRVVLLHTLAPLIPLFQDVIRQVAPELQAFHALDEALLERIRLRGGLADDDVARVAAHASMTDDIGARRMLVTCSTLSTCVDRLPEAARGRTQKVDEAMFEEALRRPGRVVVLATNPTTLEPTRDSLMAAAQRAGRSLDPKIQFVPEAFDAFRQGDFARHDLLLGAAIAEAAGRADTLVLAQASMARIVPQLGDAERAKVLSSPHLAVARLAAC